MRPKQVRRTDKPLRRALNEVGDAWSLLILWAAMNEVSRFDAFQRELGVARNILSGRLRRLTKAGLLRKAPISEGARRMEYRLTAKGRALEAALRHMNAWGDAWAVTSADGALYAAE